MDTERDLLFGILAFQNGAVDADCLAETCAAWATEPSITLADHFIDRGLITAEQRTEVEKVVAHELEAHGGDPQATLAATMDGRSMAAIRNVAGANGALEAKLGLEEHPQGGHVVLGTLSPHEPDNRDRYTLTHLHAKGGMGRVWLARDTALGRQIALKELRPDQADNSIIFSRFLYEAKITAQLEHPGIIPVYELGEGEAPYYTMRFVKGRTLNEAIRAFHKKRAAGDVDPVGRVELLTAFVGVCHAVAYAHSRGIIHRDLKGQNVVLGDFGEVMVLDWGLAKRVGPDQQAAGSPEEPAPGADRATLATGGDLVDQDPEFTLPGSQDLHGGLPPLPQTSPNTNGSADHLASPDAKSSAHHKSDSSASSGRRPNPQSGAGPEGTMQGQLLGTPAYMAPEQAQGRHDLVNQRTDVYGLGAILYEILTGRPPFIAPKTAEIIRKVCQEAPTPPRLILAEIEPALEAVCLKALRKTSEERYASVGELAQEVQRFLADLPVTAFEEPWTRRALRWARRHRTMVSAAAALLITATIGFAVSTLLVAGERNEAEAQGKQARAAVQMLTKVKDVGFDDQLDPLQKEFLTGALEYYEQFTSRVAHDPVVRLEHGRVYQQMGDIERLLGKLPESEQAYRKAIEILEPLAGHAAAGPDPRRALARSRTLLGDLLVRRGADKGQAETLYKHAAEAQQALADARDATSDDRLRLGQTLRSQGDLLRLNGQFTQAKPIYAHALGVLDQALTADSKHAEIRNELALAADARGWINRELGEITAARLDYRRSLDLLDKLVAEFPTAPRYRESLAKACNSLGLLEETTGSLVEAEAFYRRELPLVERLSQDFPDRPEHGRELARTLSNLGNVLARNRDAGAEVVLQRAVDVNGPLTIKHPEDVQIRFDLAKDYQCLGDLQFEQGKLDRALASIGESRSRSKALVKEFPDKPRYSEVLAMNLADLGLLLHALNKPESEAMFQESAAIYEKLVAAHPDNFDYQIGQARCLRDQGTVVASLGHAEQAEAIYRKALALFDAKSANAQNEAIRIQAGLLNNLGDLHLPGAEKAFGDSIALSTRLLAHQSPANKDLHNLAIAQNNLADLLVTEKRPAAAEPLFAQSVANFEKLVASAPKAIDFQSHFGIVLSLQGKLLAQTGKPALGRAALESAVEHQRQAVKLGKSQNDPYRQLLGAHQLDLADVNLKLGDYDQAARVALEIPKTVPSSNRALGCLDAARILARLVTSVSTDLKLAQAERDRLTKGYVGRTAVLLREVIDTDPKLAEQIKTDADIKLLKSRPEFQAIMDTLVSAGL